MAFASCGPTISYLGSSYGPTQTVDVFVEENAIAKSYTVIGKGYVNYYRNGVPESLQAKAVSKAREKGADAILIKDYFIPVSTTGLGVAGLHDTVGRAMLALAPQTASSGVMIVFLKYQINK